VPIRIGAFDICLLGGQNGHMDMPERDNALIPRAKLTDYLLSPTHPVGGPKARYFLALGFSPAAPEVLERALLGVARTGVVRQVSEGAHGTKYVVDGRLTTPSEVVADVRTVWLVEPPSLRPRLVTAYPL
jgi:hypothetical protein